MQKATLHPDWDFYSTTSSGAYPIMEKDLYFSYILLQNENFQRLNIAQTAIPPPAKDFKQSFLLIQKPLPLDIGSIKTSFLLPIIIILSTVGLYFTVIGKVKI
jgi:hypothetical protein